MMVYVALYDNEGAVSGRQCSGLLLQLPQESPVTCVTSIFEARVWSFPFATHA